MKTTTITLGLLFGLATTFSSCGSETKTNSTDTTTMNDTKTESYALLADWNGPYGGLPAFDKMTLDKLPEAMRQGMTMKLAEIDAIVDNKDKATFDNTIVAMEASGAPLNRLFTYYRIWSSNMSTPEFREMQKELAPEISEFSSKIAQNKGLFERIRTVYQNRENLKADQRRVVELIHDSYVMRGAELGTDAKKRYAEIDKELSELYTAFGDNVLADEEGHATLLTEDQLGGLSDDAKESMSSAAEALGEKGKYAITNTRSSMDPFLKYSTERGLREEVWRKYYSRGNNDDEHDNKKIIADILKLRDERVALLGKDNFASWRLQDRMAGTPDAAMKLMNTVWPAAIARVAEEVADMQAVANAEGADITIEPWDYRFYAEKVRKKKYDLDSDEVKQYLQLDKLREAMFFVAGELFGYDFTPITDGSVPVFHPDVKVWEVTDKADGAHRGLWYLDPYARKGKRSGAWATTYRSYSTYQGVKTVLASNNSNFIKGTEGEPVLISWDDATTFFHEFGHALHFLSSTIAYPTLDGGVRDYTEFQSQLLERWLSTDKVIDNYLVHQETGEPMPSSLIAKIKKAANFNQGFSTTEYLASALMDMKYHSIDPTDLDVASFEKKYLESIKMPKELPMRHRSTQFGHVFSGEGYAAAYYGYMWADVLTADAAEAFEKAPGGYYDQDLAKKMVDNLFAPRNLYPPAEAYRAFMGRDAEVSALMRDRGFPVK